MLETDTHLIRVDPAFTWQTDREKLIYQESDPNFTEQRWNEYRELFAKLNLQQGLIRYKNPELIVFFNEENKGIAYCNCELEPLYDSLDKIEPAKLTSRALYRKIEKGWYVYYQPNDSNWGKSNPQKNTKNENQIFHQLAFIHGL
jgi:hypothetical protein